MNDYIESIRNGVPPPDHQIQRIREEERRSDIEETERRMERPPEEGKGQVIDIYV